MGFDTMAGRMLEKLKNMVSGIIVTVTVYSSSTTLP